MFMLLRRVSLRDYRQALGRLALIIGGVASGIALVAALNIINASVLVNFRQSLERTAGKASLQVVLGTGEVGFAEDVAATVAKDPDVEYAFGLVRGSIAAIDGTEAVLQLFGVDLASDAVDAYDIGLVGDRPDPLELLNDPASVFLTRDYALRRNLAVGDAVKFSTPTGVTTLHVRGLLQPQGLATVLGGELVVMDLFAAQRLLGKEGRVDQVDVLLRRSGATSAVQRRLARRLPESLSVVRPATRGERFERALRAFQMMLDGLSLLCLLAGVFIVYNTMATAITQRARDLGVLLALGAEPRTIFALVIVEAGILGFLASLLGTAMGVGLSRVLLGLVANSMGVIYQSRFVVETFTLTPGQVLWYVLLGTLGGVASGLVPARKASRLDPLDIMRADFRERLAITSPNRLLIGVGTVLLAFALGSIGVEHLTRSIAWGNVGATLWWVAAVVFAIPLMNWVSRLLRRVLPRAFGIAGRIAAESLLRSPGRTGVTAAVIALSLTLAVTVSSVAGSFRESERNWFILIGDLVVSAVSTEGGWLETPLSPDVGEVLRSVPGVARVETYRALEGQPFRDGRVALVGISEGFMTSALVRRQVVAGSIDGLFATAGTGRDVVVSDNLADRFGIAVGDTVELPAPAGMESGHVVAILGADYSGDQGSVLIPQARLARVWGDARVSHFNLFLVPGAKVDDVRDRIRATLADRYRVKILTVPETLAYHQKMVDRAFVFTYAIQLLVIAVTLAGILDLLTTQILERRREIGTLQALGADESQLGRAITIEALVIGLSGGLLGSALSVGTSWLWVRVNFRILIGYVLEHHFALATATWCGLLTTGVAMLAGALAARNALRYPLLEALRAE